MHLFHGFQLHETLTPHSFPDFSECVVAVLTLDQVIAKVREALFAAHRAPADEEEAELDKFCCLANRPG
jgi:hypothetical protein